FAVPGGKFTEALFLGEHRLLLYPRQATVDRETPQDSVPGQNETFLAGGVPDLDVGVIEKGRVEHVLDVQELVTAEAGQRRVIEAPGQELDPDPLEALGFKLLGQLLLDDPPLPQDVHGLLVLLEHPADQGDADAPLELGKLIEGVVNDVCKPPVPEQVLVQFLELRLPVVQRKVLIDGISQLMELLVEGRISLPLALFAEGI